VTGRFAPEVEAVLRAAGWHPDRQLPAAEVAAMRRAAGQHTGRYGGRLPDHSFADPVLAEFGGLALPAPRPVTLNPARAARHVETLIDVGRALGVAVQPLGVEGADEAVLAVTDLGSVIAVDPTGEWLLGRTIEEALATLITGRRARPATAGGSRQPLGSLKRPIGAAFFLPRTPANLPYVWLPDVLVRIGVVPVARRLDPGRFQVDGWGGLRCEVHVLDLEWHTVLVLAFELSDFLGQAADRPADLPLVHAFRNACTALTPELEVGFVQTRPVNDLLRLVAERAVDVVALDGGALLAQDFGPLYLTGRVDYQVEQALNARPREELPIAGGRLLLAPAPPPP
jgi:hypothetical protein